MSPQMVEAIRHEAFVQGFLRGYAIACGVPFSSFTDEQLLAMLPSIDTVYVTYRAERTGAPSKDIAP